MNNYPKNIIAITYGTYPDNAAANIRHLLLLKGLNSFNINSELISIYSNREEKELIFENTKISNLISKKRKKLIVFFVMIGILKALLKIINLKRKKKIDILIMYCIDNSIVLPILILCKLLKIKIIHERTEHPFFYIKLNFAKRIKKMIYLKILIPRFDGLFVISTSLKEYFSNYYKKDIKIIPIIVDKDRFSNKNKPIYDFKYFAYCGNLSAYKDGVDILIKSYILFCKKHRDTKLVLVGKNKNKNEIEKYYSMLKENDLSSNVIFTGEIESSKIPEILMNANALLLSRPNNIQAKYGLPTKLGEYLMTEKPVVVTSVGDIPMYLKDNESAFICEPDSVDAFAEKLLYINQNYEKAEIVGEKGKQVCETYFDYKIQSKELIDYLIQIKN